MARGYAEVNCYKYLDYTCSFNDIKDQLKISNPNLKIKQEFRNGEQALVLTDQSLESKTKKEYFLLKETHAFGVTLIDTSWAGAFYYGCKTRGSTKSRLPDSQLLNVWENDAKKYGLSFMSNAKWTINVVYD